MNSLSLISIVLGMISVIITLKYVNRYDKLDKSIRKLSGVNKNTATLSEVIKIQDKLDISDKQLNILLSKHSDTIVKLITKDIADNTKSSNVKIATNKDTGKQIKNKSNKTIKDKPTKVKTKTDKTTKESFVNYKYTDHIQRGLKDFKFTGLIKDRSNK